MRSTDTDLDANWSGGEKLNFAWRVVPCDDLQTEYDASGDNFQRREAAIFALKRELIDRLFRGEYAALGIKTEPVSGAKVESIPTRFFARWEFVEWDADRVRAYGHTFEDVRVAGLPHGTRPDARQRAEATGAAVATEADVGRPGSTVIDSNRPEAAPKPMGRPSVMRDLQQVISDLAGEAKLDVIPSQRIARITERARRDYPNVFRGPSSPAPNTVRKALRLLGYDTGLPSAKSSKTPFEK